MRVYGFDSGGKAGTAKAMHLSTKGTAKTGRAYPQDLRLWLSWSNNSHALYRRAICFLTLFP